MNIPSTPAVYAPVLPAFQSPALKPVGLESEDSRKLGSRPVEQPAENRRLGLPANKPTPRSENAAQQRAQPSDADTPTSQLKTQLESRKAQLVRDQIQQMAQRDREVRAHEQAHMAAGGAHAGAAHYDYVRGPNGVSYAVSGEVPIDSGPAATPEATLAKAQTLRRAALAPSDPSAQDRNVAADAARLELQAQQEINQQQQHKSRASAEQHPTTQPTDEIQDQPPTAAKPLPPQEAATKTAHQTAEISQARKNLASVARQPYENPHPQTGDFLSIKA